MDWRSWVVAAGALALVAGSHAEATELGQIVPGYAYYNRPGATLAAHNAAIDQCREDVSFLGRNGQQAQPAFGGLAFALIWGGPIAGLDAGRVENCMVVRGWRVYQLSDAEGAALAALPQAQLEQRMGAMVGAASPPGRLVRRFENEAATAGGVQTASRPAKPTDRQLSLKVQSAGARPPSQLDQSGKFPPAVPGLKPGQIGSAPPDKGVILLRISGTNSRAGNGFTFNREGAYQPSGISGEEIRAYGRGQDGWLAFAVTPGRWRIAQGFFLNYCLGAPSFEVKAGEVVFAGAFDLAGRGIVPDLDLAAPRTVLDAATSARLRAAVYRNGSRQPCRGAGAIYAAEMPGGPFEPGYRWGSSAR